jgi:hypothetical protein
MGDPTFDDVIRTDQLLLQDPLSKVSRQERTRLLVSSVCGLIVAKAGILPNKIESLGIEFSTSNRKAMIIILGFVVLYFLLAFVIYGFFDILLAFVAAGYANVREIGRLESKFPGERFGRSRTTKVLFLFRAGLFEFLLPISVGTYSLVSLISTK